jgi:hypothetical protein
MKARNNQEDWSGLIVCDHIDRARYGHGPADAIEMPAPFDASGGGRSDRIDDDENDDARRRRRKAGEPKKAPANPRPFGSDFGRLALVQRAKDVGNPVPQPVMRRVAGVPL